MTMLVRDLMLPLDDVPLVSEDATVGQAAQVLHEAQRRCPAGRPPFRAVLVVNRTGQVIGKLGHLAFMRALDRGFEPIQDRAALDRAGLSPEFIRSIAANVRFWHEELPDCCSHAIRVPVTEVMLQITESLTDDLPIMSAVSSFVRLNTLSLPVRHGSEIVGLLRLADLFEEMSRHMIEAGPQPTDRVEAR